ncbi:MAG TPA: VOC family protein [Steroidobacteraceae bacterium]|nr:VOC family protein [Steroidobacteraceae bacterium]
MLLGLRSAFYYVDDLAAARAWYTRALGFAPYFDQPFYVGFQVGGFELGLVPHSTPEEGTPMHALPAKGAHWGVKDISAAYARLLELGAEPRMEIKDVGDGIRVADVIDPFGNVLGIIENPNFNLSERLGVEVR